MFWIAIVLIPGTIYAFVAERTSPMRIRGKLVLVTGASETLGRAVAIEAARLGAQKVILVSLRSVVLREVAAECTAAATFPDFEVSSTL